GGVERGILQNLVGGNARLDVEFEFAMERESGHGVGAGFDGDSGTIKQAGELHHLGERCSVGFVHAGGRSQALREQAAANLRGQAAGDGLEANGDVAGAVQVLIFENAEREIELGVVILQQLDEGLDLGRSEVEAGSSFSGFDQSGDGVCVFDLGKEIQDEKIHVLNFVEAEIDALRGDHFGGNVSADAEAVFVGFVDDRGHEFGLDRAVDFDLHVAEAFVVVYGGASFGFGRDQDFGGSVVGVGAVDDSGQDDAGADFFSVDDALAAGEERVGVVGEVAYGGDSGGQIEEAVVIADVGVHVPEAGEQGFAGGVDDLRPRIVSGH